MLCNPRGRTVSRGQSKDYLKDESRGSTFCSHQLEIHIYHFWLFFLIPLLLLCCTWINHVFHEVVETTEAETKPEQFLDTSSYLYMSQQHDLIPKHKGDGEGPMRLIRRQRSCLVCMHNQEHCCTSRKASLHMLLLVQSSACSAVAGLSERDDFSIISLALFGTGRSPWYQCYKSQLQREEIGPIWVQITLLNRITTTKTNWKMYFDELPWPNCFC